MGSIQLPKTLTGWGRYCDCLQNIDRFRIQKSQTQQHGEIPNEKALEVSQYAIKSRGLKNKQPPTAQSIQTPPPIKQQSKTNQKKQKHAGPLLLKKLGHQTIEQLSQFSDMPAVKDNIFDVVRIEEDQDIKNHIIDHISPMHKDHEQKIRATAPNPSENYFFNHPKANNTTYTSKNPNRPTKNYFLDEKDKEQYLNNEKPV